MPCSAEQKEEKKGTVMNEIIRKKERNRLMDLKGDCSARGQRVSRWEEAYNQGQAP
jgi:hypothetical protein